MWPYFLAAFVPASDPAVTAPPETSHAAVVRIGPRQDGPAPPGTFVARGSDAGAHVPTGSLSHEPTEGANLAVAGIVRFVFELTTGTPLGSTTRGATFDDVLIAATGRVGDSVFYVETDFAEGELVLEEAWFDFALDRRHRLRVGQVQRRFLASQEWPEDALPMISRSLVDVRTTVHDVGAIVDADYGRLRLAATFQNADEGPTGDWRAALRGEFDALGTGAASRGDHWRSPRAARLTFGASVADDGSVAEGASIALDGALRWEGFATFFEWVDLGRDIGDARPFSVTVSSALEPDVLDLAVRYEDVDDGSDTTVLGVALTRWVAPGRLKVQIGADRVRSDDAELQGTRFMLATVLSFW